MAAVTITDVGVTVNTETILVVVDEAASVGNVLYKETDGKWKKGIASTSELTAGRDGLGILLTKVDAAGQYGLLAVGGTILIDTGLTKSDVYILGATAGSIHPDVDSLATWYKTVIGVAGDESVSTNYDELDLILEASGHVQA